MAARYRLRSELIRRARAAVGSEKSTHVKDDPELYDEVDIAARLLLDIHLEHDGTEAYRTTASVELVVGQSLYPLFTYQVLGVYASRGAPFEDRPGHFVLAPAKPFSRVLKFEESNRLDLMNGTYSGPESLAYRLGGVDAFSSPNNLDCDQLEVQPTPSRADGVLLIVYIPQPTLTVTEDPPDVQVFAPGGSSDWIVARLCAYIRTKEDKDPSKFLAQMAEVEERVRRAANRRDAGEPNRMQGRRYSTRHDQDEDFEPRLPWR